MIKQQKKRKREEKKKQKVAWAPTRQCTARVCTDGTFLPLGLTPESHAHLMPILCQLLRASTLPACAPMV